MNAPKLVFLAAHVQPFLLSGIQRLISDHGASVLLVHWPAPGNSPTDIPTVPGLTILEKNTTSSADIGSTLEAFSPDILYAAGWMDKDYLNWARKQRKRGVKTVMGMDTQWTGSWKQRLNCLFSGMFIRSVFTHAWVPGPPQARYARKLGFTLKQILENLLVPDTDIFIREYKKALQAKEMNYPHTLVYAGRLLEQKFDSLLSAFTGMESDQRKGWKLVVIGSGPLGNDDRMKDKDIVYKGFMQQDELAAEIANAGIFCLTSAIEPWGTVIHEAAAAGLPMIVSKQCGASSSFVQNGYNGQLCDGNSVESTRSAISSMISRPDAELLLMGKRSFDKGSTRNSATWAQTLMSIYQQ